MKLIKKILVVLLVFIAIIIGIYAYFGGFNKIEFKEVEIGEEVVVYREMIGSYNKSGDLMKLVCEELEKDYGVDASIGIGIYYDNPDMVEAEKLRSEIGSIIITDDNNKIEELKKVFSVKTLPKQEYLSVELPLKGFFSIMIGAFKVYPQIEEYLNENGYSNKVPIMEIYDKKKNIITYRTILVKQ